MIKLRFRGLWKILNRAVRKFNDVNYKLNLNLN